MDFVADALVNGKRIRALAVGDNFTLGLRHVGRASRSTTAMLNRSTLASGRNASTHVSSNKVSL